MVLDLCLQLTCCHKFKGILLCFVKLCIKFRNRYYLTYQNKSIAIVRRMEMPETMTQTKPEQETVQISASQGQLDVLDQLLKPEVQESLTTLVEQLPKLTELVNILTKSYDFAQTVATDEVLKATLLVQSQSL